MRNDEIPLKHRMFNVVFIVGIFMSFSCALMKCFMGEDKAAALASFACGVITVGLYIAFRVSRNYNLLSLIGVIFSSFVFFPVMWLMTGGTFGGIPYYLIVNAGIIALLLTGQRRRIIFGLFAAAVGVLLHIEYKFPDLAAVYKSPLDRQINYSFGLFVCLISAAVLIAALADGYAKELEKSRRSNAELIQVKEEAERLNRLLSEEKQKLHLISITDFLTGTYNRRFIMSYLNDEIEASREKKRKLTLALIDIDDFKTVNDTYGHVYGDYVIERISRTIKSNLRQNDIVGRYGGDEFLIILPNTGIKEGCAVIERVRRKVAELEWEKDFSVTISGGLMEVEDDKTTGLLIMLDRLLYSAKHKGKNLIEFPAQS